MPEIIFPVFIIHYFSVRFGKCKRRFLLVAERIINHCGRTAIFACGSSSFITANGSVWVFIPFFRYFLFLLLALFMRSGAITPATTSRANAKIFLPFAPFGLCSHTKCFYFQFAFLPAIRPETRVSSEY